MSFRQSPRVLLTSFLIVGLTGRASIAFNIIPPTPGATRYYQPVSTYRIDNDREGRTEIDMRLWSQPLPRGGTSAFKRTLLSWSHKSEKGLYGWSFRSAAEDLKGSFEVITYQACGLLEGCGGASTSVSNINPPYRGVGSLFHLKYHPGQGDPQPGEGKLHWIQMVQANYGRGLPGVPLIAGVPFIDNFNRKQNPYYDRPNSRFAGEDFFTDQPYSGGLDSASRPNYFKAELYLVQETTPPGGKQRTATIYNGITWGWKNTITRRKQPVPVPVPVPAPTPNPIPFFIPPLPSIPRIPRLEPKWIRSDASGGGGIGYVPPTPSPTPRPTPSPWPTPAPWTPSPWPTPAPWATAKPSPQLTSSPLPSPSPWPTPTPWVTSQLGSKSSTVVLSKETTITSPSPRLTSSPLPSPSPRPTPTPSATSRQGSTSSTVVVSRETTIASPSPFPKPSSPAPSPGGRPIQAVPSSWIPNANAQSLRKSSLFESSSKANTDYAAFSINLLEDPELSSTDNSLNNANVAGVSRDLLETPEQSSTDGNENQVNLAGISSDLLENSELSSTDNDEDNPDIGGISADLLEDPELSSTDSDENNPDLADISADLLEDPELSSEAHNSEQVDLAGISSDLLEDPELSYLDDTLTAQTEKVSSKNSDDDALPAEPVPEPTTALGTLLAASVLPVIKRLKNRKNKE